MSHVLKYIIVIICNTASKTTTLLLFVLLLIRRTEQLLQNKSSYSPFSLFSMWRFKWWWQSTFSLHVLLAYIISFVHFGIHAQMLRQEILLQISACLYLWLKWTSWQQPSACCIVPLIPEPLKYKSKKDFFIQIKFLSKGFPFHLAIFVIEILLNLNHMQHFCNCVNISLLNIIMIHRHY